MGILRELCLELRLISQGHQHCNYPKYKREGICKGISMPRVPAGNTRIYF